MPCKTHPQLVPAILQGADLLLDVVSSEVSLCHHLTALVTYGVDARFVAGQLSLQGLVLLHQVLHPNEVTTCNNGVTD